MKRHTLHVNESAASSLIVFVRLGIPIPEAFPSRCYLYLGMGGVWICLNIPRIKRVRTIQRRGCYCYHPFPLLLFILEWRGHNGVSRALLKLKIQTQMTQKPMRQCRGQKCTRVRCVQVKIVKIVVCRGQEA